MRFSTYLNNAKCMEWKINAQQGILFALLYEAPAWAKEEIIENKAYYFVSRNLILEELPMFFEKSDTVYRNLKVLQEKGLIEYIKQGKKDLIKITAITTIATFFMQTPTRNFLISSRTHCLKIVTRGLLKGGKCKFFIKIDLLFVI